jgi:hypothetical protein
VVVAALAIAVGTRAHAGNGFYVAESFGAGAGHGGLGDAVGGALHVRLGFGARYGNFAIEPWIAQDLQTDRNGGFKGLIGGQPADGSADIEMKGIDARYIIPVDRHIDLYVRGGPLLADGNGALAGYHGAGVGGAAGAALTGRVRALGFLWTPLFFVDRGPMVTGALYLDAGYDQMWLRMGGAPRIDAGVAHVSIGFAIGSGF